MKIFQQPLYIHRKEYNVENLLKYITNMKKIFLVSFYYS